MDTSELTDEALLTRVAVTGHFEELYRRHVNKVTTFATRRCSRAHEVPDLVAGVWLEVIASSPSFDPRKGPALPWILGVAANLTASNERRRSREQDAIDRLGRRPVLDPETAADLDARIDAMEPARRAMQAMEDLPHGERLMAELVLIEGLEPREAAAALRIKPATARMRLLRARKKLRGSISPFRLTPEHPLSVSGGMK
jgi:RNA polymerase sigma factor (sigma-70 family)